MSGPKPHFPEISPVIMSGITVRDRVTFSPAVLELAVELILTSKPWKASDLSLQRAGVTGVSPRWPFLSPLLSSLLFKHHASGESL